MSRKTKPEFVRPARWLPGERASISAAESAVMFEALTAAPDKERLVLQRDYWEPSNGVRLSKGETYYFPRSEAESMKASGVAKPA